MLYGCRCSQNRFLAAPNGAPERARATVFVPALEQASMQAWSRRSPFGFWVSVGAPCFCFWSLGLGLARREPPRCRYPPCLRSPHRRRHRRLRRWVDVHAWRVHSCWHLRLRLSVRFPLVLGTARGCCGSLARSKSLACHRRLSNPSGIVHVLRPSVVRYRDR